MSNTNRFFAAIARRAGMTLEKLRKTPLCQLPNSPPSFAHLYEYGFMDMGQLNKAIDDWLGLSDG